MSSNALSQTMMRVLLFEGGGIQSLPPEDRSRLLHRLLTAGYPVSCVRADGALSPADACHLVVLGRFDGDPPSLAKDPAKDVTVFFLDISELDDDALIKRIEGFRTEAEARKPGEWHPWFPVIDYDRCTNCMQCLSFCLFGVYNVSAEKEIRVENRDKCKTNCPACSRVCPEAAIMFPKYRNGPVNGDKVNEDSVSRESMKIDISALLGGDIYATLRDRSEQAKERFAKERDDDRALMERQRCLAKMQKDMDIPTEVLMSLPSMDEIQKRAEEAKAKAQDVLDWRQESVRPEDRA